MIDQKSALVTSADGKVVKFMVDNESQTLVTTVVDTSVHKIDVIPTKKLALLGTEDSSLQFWDLENMKLLHEYKHMNFKIFQTDINCTMLLFLNPKCKYVEFYHIQWLLDDKKIKDKSSVKMPNEVEALGGGGVGKERSKTACCQIF